MCFTIVRISSGKTFELQRFFVMGSRTPAWPRAAWDGPRRSYPEGLAVKRPIVDAFAAQGVPRSPRWIRTGGFGRFPNAFQECESGQFLHAANWVTACWPVSRRRYRRRAVTPIRERVACNRP